jgi:hypothetical protein
MHCSGVVVLFSIFTYFAGPSVLFTINPFLSELSKKLELQYE